MEQPHDERVKQVVIGAGILMLLSAGVAGTLLGWRLLPGVLGEWVGMVIGIMTTPFFLEASFAILGLVLVITLNQWRQHKEGDDFVYLEQVTGPELPHDLPEQAKWALYRDRPLDAVGPTLLEQAEGAFAIGEFAAAAEWIAAMDHSEMQRSETLRLRLELAKATGRNALARDLEAELRVLDA